MPLNQPNLSKYKPNPVGAVKLSTRSSTRARLTKGGTYFRSKERGEQQNLIKIGAFEDGAEGTVVVHHTQLKPTEQVFPTDVTPELEIFKLGLEWNEELHIVWSVPTSTWRAEKRGIRWQTAPGGPPFATIDLGEVRDGLINFGFATFKLTGLASWPTSATLVLRPRTYRFTLVPLSVTDPTTSVVSTGWDIGALRTTLNASSPVWVTMPGRGTAGDAAAIPPTQPTTGEDPQDTGVDATFLTVFAMTNMSGADGLPAAPVGLNTGPDRVMVHLNYAEKDNGSMGELNQVYEWIGDTATIGSWQRYS